MSGLKTNLLGSYFTPLIFHDQGDGELAQFVSQNVWSVSIEIPSVYRNAF